MVRRQCNQRIMATSNQKVFREVGLQIRWLTVKRQDDKDLSNIVFILKEKHDFLSLFCDFNSCFLKHWAEFCWYLCMLPIIIYAGTWLLVWYELIVMVQRTWAFFWPIHRDIFTQWPFQPNWPPLNLVDILVCLKVSYQLVIGACGTWVFWSLEINIFQRRWQI